MQHQIKRHFTPKIDGKRKLLDSNAGNATPRRIISRTWYLIIKKTVALLVNVQFHQFHPSHVTHEVKFPHNLSKTI